MMTPKIINNEFWLFKTTISQIVGRQLMIYDCLFTSVCVFVSQLETFHSSLNQMRRLYFSSDRQTHRQIDFRNLVFKIMSYIFFLNWFWSKMTKLYNSFGCLNPSWGYPLANMSSFHLVMWIRINLKKAMNFILSNLIMKASW